MATTYRVQRADLRGYHRMLATWREAASPDLAAAMDHSFTAIKEVEEDMKAVLGILAAVLDGALRA